MRIVVAITGASGTIYGIRLVEYLSKTNEVYVILTEGAKRTAKYEIENEVKFPENVKVFSEKDIDAPIASSSFMTDAMVVCPCSMKTLSAISIGYSDNLVTRCADVILKEKRKLVLAFRETPLSSIHLENMLKLSLIGAIIFPLSPGWYHNPKNLENIVNFIIGKIADTLNIENNLYRRWGS